MSIVTGVSFAACLLLVAGSVGKLANPRPLTGSLRRLRLPGNDLLVRSVSAVEAALGLTAAIGGSRPAWAAVAASYVGFTAFVALVRRRGGALASCGCFGAAETPATRLHLIVTAGYAVAAALAAASPTAPGLLAGGPSGYLVVLAAAAGLSYLSFAALTLLPRVRGLSLARG